MRFLEEIVEVVLNRYAESTDKVTIVFPNRRAGLFFQKYLGAKIYKPIWSPKILSIEDFIKNMSDLKSADKLELIFELYTVFKKLNKSKEAFDQFFYWGNIMLRDFDELDKFLTDPELLFKNLIHIKTLENNLDYLQEEQKKLISEFWQSFDEKLSSHQKGFLAIWDNLFQTYTQFKTVLSDKGMAYDGMIYREVAESLEGGNIHGDTGTVIFAGFNALSKSEEQIISWFLKEGKGEIYWDADDYYLDDNKQEAGKFLREMKFGNPVLRKSFKESYGNAFKNINKNIEVISIASDSGQAQQASELLNHWNSSNEQNKLDENTAVILPNNELLFPLLHAMPTTEEQLNITMGYPLTSSTVYRLLEELIALQMKSGNKDFYHFRPVLSILRHPLIGYNDDEVTKIIDDIIRQNIIWIHQSKFDINHDLLKIIFKKSGVTLSEYLLDILQYLASRNKDEVDGEFFYHFYLLLNKLNEFIKEKQIEISVPAYQKLFRQLAQAERLPFEGEPLLGLQVMGILETRNLDFDNIIVLSMNESLIPPTAKNTSFIPYSIRKVFELPVVDQQDTMYAYIFYRLIQRAKNIHFIYNSTEETGKSGEVSRFVRQLEHETDFNIIYKTISTEATVEDPRMISVFKNERILDNLYRFTSNNNFQKRFTPTALSTYLDCRLRFYFKYVLELYELEEVSEEVDPMVFGNILHHTMEQLYLPFDNDGKRTVSNDDIADLKTRVDAEIGLAFSKQFGTDGKEFNFEGQNMLAKEIIRKMILKVIEFDKQRTPFDILGVEADDKKGFVLNFEIEIDGSAVNVGMKGIIDRIERKDDVIRIVDYKTGKDNKDFPDIISLFDRENKSRNKAVFQTFFYGLLYMESPIGYPELPIQTSLFNIRELFNEEFSPLIRQKIGKVNVDVLDIRVFLDEFKIELKKLLEEIYDPGVLFSQTDDNKKCGYCPYAGICNR